MITMSKKSSKNSKKSSEPVLGILQSLDAIFGNKGPVQLPNSTKDWIAKWAWFFALIGVIIRGFGLLTLLGLGAVFSGLAASTGSFSFFSTLGLSIIFLSAEGLLLLIATPGLKNMKIGGWNFAFYAELVAIVGNLLSFNLLGAVIAAVIGFFFLFQIRSRFSK